MKTLRTLIVPVLLAYLFLLFSSNATAASLDSFAELQGNISIAGGTAHTPIMNEAKARIEQFNRNILILVRGGGSTYGIQQAGKGLVDIGNAGRSLKPAEKEKYNLESIPLAVDALVIVVHPSNPVSKLGSDTLRSIFLGKIKNWQEVGGIDKSITVYSRDPGSGTKAVFIKKFLKEEPVESAQILSNHYQMKVAITMDKAAIGYMSTGIVEKTKVKPLGLDGVEPTLENIQTGRYPLSRTLYMNINADKAKVTKLTKRFIQYMIGPDMKPVIKKAGFISRN